MPQTLQTTQATEAIEPSPAPHSVSAVFSTLLDIRLPIEVILGTTTLTVRACLRLERNSVVRLAQPAGLDLQVAANGVVLARGEVVIVEDSTAIRITEIEGQNVLELP